MEITVDGNAVFFRVRVQPRASRDAIEGEHVGALKVRLTAPPMEGRANDSLRRLLAGRLNVPLSAVRIVSGENSSNKRVSVAGVTRAQLQALCSPPGNASTKARTRLHAEHSSNPIGIAREQN
jgi:uncharacterized protein